MLWQGLMGTFDEVTRKFFDDTKVQCKLVLRGTDQQKNVIKSNIGATNYTHHQKSVILDTASDGSDSSRRVTAYVGGIDLTSGRYDSAEHSLFGTLSTTHSADYYQSLVPGAVQACGGAALCSVNVATSSHPLGDEHLSDELEYNMADTNGALLHLCRAAGAMA